MQSAYQAAFGLYLLFYYKESALFFDFSFWFHQEGIPHRMCRFYLLLAGAVEERQGIAIPYPSPTPLLTPGGIRCGGAFWLPRVCSNIGSCIQVQVAYPQFRIWFGNLCSALYRSHFSRVVGLVSFVFHYWGEGRLFLRLRWVLQWSFVGFALTAGGSFVWVGNGVG